MLSGQSTDLLFANYSRNAVASLRTLYMKTGRLFFLSLFGIILCLLGVMYYNLSSFSFLEKTYVPSFQEMIDCSYFVAFYLAMHLAVIFGIILTSLKLRTKGNQNYTLQRLSISEKERYLACLFLCFLSYFSVILLQNIGILLSYLLYAYRVPDALQLSNGLTYAYLNQPFMRAIAPAPHPLRIAHFLITLGLLSLLSLRLSICIRKQNFFAALGYAYLLFCTSLQSIDGTFTFRPVLILCMVGLGILYAEIQNLKTNAYF